MDLQWWIAVIAVPVVGGLVTAIVALWRAMKSGDDAVRAAVSAGDGKLHERIDSHVKDDSDYRVQAAEKFTTRAELRDLGSEIKDDLRRIETKLDRMAEIRGDKR